jgi:hypothetical protein
MLAAIVAISAIALTGCNKTKQLANINFDIPYNQQVAVPSSGYTFGTPLPPGGITLPFPAVPVPTNAQQYISTYHTSADKILAVNLKSLSLQILSPAGQTFDFLDNVDLYISAKNQQEVLIASQHTVAKGLTTLQLNADESVNLKNYFIQDTMYFRMTTHINAVPPDSAQLKISSVFHVLANPLE